MTGSMSCSQMAIYIYRYPNLKTKKLKKRSHVKSLKQIEVHPIKDLNSILTTTKQPAKSLI